MSIRPDRLLWLTLFSLSVLFAQDGGFGEVRFEDVTAVAGIRWTHVNGATEEKYLIETMGGGGAFLDYNNDGWLDIYLVNSGAHQRSGSPPASRNALYRNNRDGTFSDVTEKAGAGGRGYGNGVAVADYDNDGWQDIYVTCFGSNILYRNRRDGTFEDVTDRAGVAVNKWSTSAAFFDMENDGDLDLFVGVYMDWDYDKNIYCGSRKEGFRSYCHPQYFDSIPSVLLINNGDGTFSDVTARAGVDVPGKALGVVTADLDGDGFAEIHVANDTVANFLYRNLGDGTFEETGLLAGIAYGVDATPESGMGTDFGDVNGDGRLDLIVSNIDREMNNLYLNRGDGFFDDATISWGLGSVALPFSGFGLRFLDYDNDGDLDLVILNGHVLDNIELYHSGVEFAERPFLFENRDGKFREIGEEQGGIWRRKMVGRGLAAGDYDNDGDLDLLFVNNGQPPVLLRNQGGNSNRWLGLRLVGVGSSRDAVGAVVTVGSGEGTIVRHRMGGGSYQSAHDPRLLFGLARKDSVQYVEVRWPTGATQRLQRLKPGSYHTVKESAH